MRMSYLGDSYDIVKKSLLLWLSDFGSWSVLPMFTESVSSEEVSSLETLLGAPVLTSERVGPAIERPSYFGKAHSSAHLFIDPNTGFRLNDTNAKNASNFLFAQELFSLSKHRSHFLTMVFDQSLGHGREKHDLQHKLQWLRERDISNFAYYSHACFIICSHDEELVERARTEILRKSKLPESRFITATTAEQAVGAGR
jgi:hypothetical protein